MIRRFCAYTTLKNLRLFDPFFVLYLLLELELSYLAVRTPPGHPSVPIAARS